MAEALDSAELRALSRIDRYAERERYAAAVAKALADHAFAELTARFDEHGIWHERVQSYDELAQDRQAAHMGAFSEYEVHGRKVRLVAHPLRYDGKAPGIRTMPLEPGCDSRAILSEAGFSGAEIDLLAAEGVIASPVPAAA